MAHKKGDDETKSSMAQDFFFFKEKKIYNVLVYGSDLMLIRFLSRKSNRIHPRINQMCIKKGMLHNNIRNAFVKFKESAEPQSIC